VTVGGNTLKPAAKRHQEGLNHCHQCDQPEVPKPQWREILHAHKIQRAQRFQLEDKRDEAPDDTNDQAKPKGITSPETVRRESQNNLLHLARPVRQGPDHAQGQVVDRQDRLGFRRSRNERRQKAEREDRKG
jgi:hypothetical protein